jgi:AraC family transcriptional regulator
MNTRFLTSTFTLLNTDVVSLNKSWNYRHVTSAFYRLYYIEDGRGMLFHTGGRVVLEKGYLYLIPAFTTCDYTCDRFLKQHYITFTEETLDGASLFDSNRRIFKIPAGEAEVAAVRRVLRLNPARGLQLSYNPAVYEKAAILKRYREANNALRVCDFLETCGILMQLVSRFMASPEFQEPEGTVIHAKVAAAVHFIQTHLQDVITVSLLAGRANQSADYFSKLFYENTGERPLSYIQNRRVERAQLLLATTDLSFADIAVQCGFESQPYFARIFKQRTGITASDYKKSHHVRMIS